MGVQSTLYPQISRDQIVTLLDNWLYFCQSKADHYGEAYEMPEEFIDSWHALVQERNQPNHLMVDETREEMVRSFKQEASSHYMYVYRSVMIAIILYLTFSLPLWVLVAPHIFNVYISLHLRRKLKEIQDTSGQSYSPADTIKILKLISDVAQHLPELPYPDSIDVVEESESDTVSDIGSLVKQNRFKG